MKNPLILDGIRVASPCQANWDAMSGDDVARFCSDCSKNVYNISGMKTSDALALIAEREGDLCVRFYRRLDGTVLTADCPVGAIGSNSGRWRKITSLGLVGLAMASPALANLGLGENTDPSLASGVSLNDWIDWALIKIGWRKPAPRMLMGKLISTRSPGETISADEY
jgi:hypothetical protein